MQHTTIHTETSVWIEEKGVLPTWDRLIGDVVAEIRRAQADVQLLSRPIWVVTSSALLRARLATAIAHHSGGSALGVNLVTLRGAALAVLRSVGENHQESGTLFPVLVRREATQQVALHDILAEFDDGFRPVVDPVRDLLDAGWEPELLPGALEWAEESLPSPQREHVSALLRTADHVRQTTRALSVLRTTDLLAHATALLETHPHPIVARAVLVYGIGDATGRAIDFLERLVRRVPTRVYLETPEDPSNPGTIDAGARFTQRFSGRLKPLCVRDPRPQSAAPRPTLRTFDATGDDAEVQTVARRIRYLLDQGVKPESILVVARTLSPYLTAIRHHFTQYGIPFSMPGETQPELFPPARTIAAFLTLLTDGKDTKTATWFDTFPKALTIDWFTSSMPADPESTDAAPVPSAAPNPTLADLHLALRTLAAHTVSDTAQLVDSRLEHDVSLPIRHGLVDPEDTDDTLAQSPRAIGRRIPRHLIIAVRAAAQRIVAHLDSWPQNTNLAEHAGNAKQAAVLACGLNLLDGRLHTELFAALDTIGTLAPPAIPFSRTEFLIAARAVCTGLGQQPLAGAGAGVTVTGCALARSVTAQHLFLMGLMSGTFPRIIREDPLLPDKIRTRLAQLLPDIPIKSLGHDEERFLFAQCLSSAPDITLSWQRADADGRELSPSVFIQQLRTSQPDIPHDTVPRDVRNNVSHAHPLATRLRPAAESLLYAALSGDRSTFIPLLPHLWPPQSASLSHTVVAQTRVNILAEMDPDLRTELGRRTFSTPNAWFGLVGQPGSFGNRVTVTALEQYAACPWQTFLTRVLQLEPPPDSGITPPGISANLIGNSVHFALQLIVDSAIAQSQQTDVPWARRTPVPVPWPSPAELTTLCAQAAEKVALDAQLVFPGIHRVLAELTLPYLEAASRFVWGASGQIATLGAEVDGFLVIHDDKSRPIHVRFRADRADHADHADHNGGVMSLVDYKTGRPKIDTLKPDSRAKHLVDRIRHGALLQGAVYALFGPGTGTYAYVRPDLDDRKRLIEVSHDDPVVMDTFHQSTAHLLSGMADGVMFPRLELPNGEENPRCEFCPVTEACTRGDSGGRRRIREWVHNHRGEPVLENPTTLPPTVQLTRRLVELWWLGEPPPEHPHGD